MKQKQTPKNQNAKALYDLILNYQIIGHRPQGIAQKVSKVQELLRHSKDPYDDEEALRLLEQVCYGKRRTKDLPVRLYAYSIPKHQIEEAIEEQEFALSRELPQGLPSIFSRIGHSIPEPEKKVDYVDDWEDEAASELLYVTYALAAALHSLGKGTGRDPNEAIRMLRIAEKCGSKQGAKIEELAQKVLEDIIKEEDEETIADTTKSYVEVKDRFQEEGVKSGERYDIILHDADGGVSKIDIRGRSKFVYLLALMTTKRTDATKLRARLFYAYYDNLVHLAKQMNVSTGKIGYDEWVYDFGYTKSPEYKYNKEKKDEPVRYIPDAHNYSMTKRLINNKIKNETFQIVSLGSKQNSVMFLPIKPEQIILPDSLMWFVNDLPSDKTVLDENPKYEIWLPYREK